jgi:hypothetical protein
MKKLQPDSVHNVHDVDNDGVVTDEELSKSELIMKLENEDKKQEAQRKMAWWAIIGMMAYPVFTVLVDAFGFNASLLVSMADLYFIASAGIVAAFYGKEAYMSKRQY